MAVKAEMATRVVALKVAMEAAAMVAAVPGVMTVAVKGLSPAAGPAEPLAPPCCKLRVVCRRSFRAARKAARRVGAFSNRTRLLFFAEM